MRVTSLPLPVVLMPIILLGACGQQNGNEAGQPGVVTNIMDQALPHTDEPAPPANAIVPVEPAPTIETPEPTASSAGAIPPNFILSSSNLPP